MTFFEAYEEMKKGKIICRVDSSNIMIYLKFSDEETFYKDDYKYDQWMPINSIFIEEIEATNWEIINVKD